MSDRYGPRITSVLAAAATVPIMASYGFVRSIPVIMLMVLPQGLMEAVQSPGSQAAVADAAPHEDAAAAQGLGEAAGSAAAAIGALTAAPLYRVGGAGPDVAPRRRGHGVADRDQRRSSTGRCCAEAHRGRRRPGRRGRRGRRGDPGRDASRRLCDANRDHVSIDVTQAGEPSAAVAPRP